MKASKKAVFHVVLFIALIACSCMLTFGDFRALYAIFRFAPASWGILGVQCLVLCLVHFVCIAPVILYRAPDPVFLLINFLSVNTAMWACAREQAFTHTYQQTYLKIYEYSYLILLLVTALVWFLCKRRSCKEKQSVLPAAFMGLGSLYFIAISLLPYSQSMEARRLLIAIYTGNRVFLLFLLSVCLLFYATKYLRQGYRAVRK